MVEVRTYQIKPTDLIPNSPYVLIHYPGLLLEATKGQNFNAAAVADIFGKNGWHTQWVARYGPTQGSHYHSAAHECMAVVSGQGATIRFGAADTNDDMEENTHGSGFEDNGTYVKAGMGDVFVIPAGVAHKTFDPVPKVMEDTEHMAPGEGHLTAEPEEARKALAGVKLDGRFMMVGAYPYGGEWDWAVGGDHKGLYEKVWSVPRPEKDPVLGTSPEGLVGLWKQKGPLSKL
jgi:uncharacterized protein YjlB